MKKVKTYADKETVLKALLDYRNVLGNKYAYWLERKHPDRPDLFGKLATSRWLFYSVDRCTKSDNAMYAAIALRSDLFSRYDTLSSDECMAFFTINDCLYGSYKFEEVA